MTNILLYLITIAIWGSSFLAIGFQISHGGPAVSVFYRFILASFLMLLLCILMRRPLNYFTLADHFLIAVQGFFLFCMNFWLIYKASFFLTTGLIATVFSTIVVMNVFGSALVFKTRIAARMLLAAAAGFFGILTIFWHEIESTSLDKNMVIGLLYGLGGTVSASIGMLMSAWFQKLKLPLIPTNTLGMAYGALLAALITLINGEEFLFPIDTSYVLSLLFLSVFASVIAFWSFLTLIGRIGPGYASYAMVFFPIVSLTLSTIFENYQWDINSLVGALLVILGNFLILKFKKDT